MKTREVPQVEIAKKNLTVSVTKVSITAGMPVRLGLLTEAGVGYNNDSGSVAQVDRASAF